MPLYFLALERDCPSQLCHFLHKYLQISHLQEKDCNGNTGILRAVQNGQSPEFLENFLKLTGGQSVTDRNKDGLTARELAQQMNRQDLVATIDQFVCSQVGQMFLIHLPVNFYGEDKLNISNQDGRSLLELAANNKTDMQAIQQCRAVEKLGTRLFRAAARGDVEKMVELNTANYRDQNGYTALIRAVVFMQHDIAYHMLVMRPGLKLVADNSNRYPLHYAYALPDEDESKFFVKLLLTKNPEEVEHKVDKDGREPVEYKDLRTTPEIQEMLEDARTCNAYGTLDPPFLTKSSSTVKQTSDALIRES